MHGRAGRENLPGKVIIQSYNPENFSIQCAKEQNYKKFYETEIALRKQLKYPPFCDIIVVNFNSEEEKQMVQASQWMYEYLKENLDKKQFSVFKPMPAPIDKIQNKIRWRMIIKGNMQEKANEICNECLRKVYEKQWKSTKITMDVNPNSML